MNISTKDGIDIVDVSSTEEAIKVLKCIENNTSSSAKEILSSTSLRGLSITDTVRVYAKFTNVSCGDKVVLFENGKNKTIQRQLWREIA